MLCPASDLVGAMAAIHILKAEGGKWTERCTIKYDAQNLWQISKLEEY